MLFTEIFPFNNTNKTNSIIHDRVKSLRAKANLERSFFAKAVDKVNEITGTSIFLVFNILFFVLWVLINNNFISFIPVFDPFPHNFLTMTVSLEAIVLSILVLISQSRDAKLTDLREEVTLELLVTTEAEVTKALRLLGEIAKKSGIQIERDNELRMMEQRIDTNQLVKRVEKEIGDTLM